MKKIISSILSLVMVLSMSTVAFAETNEFVLTYSNKASYEIMIPDSCDIDVSTGKGVLEVMIVNANLEDNTMVSITATSSNYTDGSWYLVNEKNDADKIAYNIGTTDGGSDITNGSEILYSESLPLDSPVSTTLYITVDNTGKVGTFTDTITFTSEIVSSLIEFHIFETNYYAERDMTWGEWYESDYCTDKDLFRIVNGVFEAYSPVMEGWTDNLFAYDEENNDYWYLSINDTVIPNAWWVDN